MTETLQSGERLAPAAGASSSGQRVEAAPAADASQSERRLDPMPTLPEQAAVRINWQSGLAKPVVQAAPAKGSEDWREAFVNHLGRSEAQRNPNANLRIQVNVAPKLKADLSVLHSNV